MKKFIIILLILAVCAGGVYYSMTSMSRQIVLTGIVTTDDVVVSPQVQGRLQKLNVKQGDVVKAGDVLAIIQPDQWQADMNYYTSSHQMATTQVSQAQAELQYQELQSKNLIAQAQANVESAKAQVVEGQADLDNAKITFDREDELFKQGAETAQAHDQARAGFESQKAHVDSLQKQERATEAALAMAQSSVQQIAARKAALDAMSHQRDAAQAQQEKADALLGYTTLKAPVNGIVDVRAALEGEVVTPGQAVVTLVDPDDLWVRADVEETYIDSVHLGDKMTVRLPSGKELEGTVFYRGVDADYATQRDVSRTKRDIKTFEVRLRCDNKDRQLALGMTAYVLLPIGK